MLRTLNPLTRFDQCVLNISLINLCNSTSYVGQTIRRLANPWDDDEPTQDPWKRLHQITLYIPHPDQLYDGITLETGLTQGYNLEAKSIENPSTLPYVPHGGQFIVVLKQKGLDAGYDVAATGIFVRPLALLSLDIVLDPLTPEYESIVVKHPIVRDYPSDWQNQLSQFLCHTRPYEALPSLVGYVDPAVNSDYRPPTWNEVHLAAKGFAGV
jgi:hypothetical protein